MCSPHDYDHYFFPEETMTIFCNECHTESPAPEAAQTSNGKPGVCPHCYSENYRNLKPTTIEQVLENTLGEIRRATKVREFVLGGL